MAAQRNSLDMYSQLQNRNFLRPSYPGNTILMSFPKIHFGQEKLHECFIRIFSVTTFLQSKPGNHNLHLLQKTSLPFGRHDKKDQRPSTYQATPLSNDGIKTSEVFYTPE